MRRFSLNAASLALGIAALAGCAGPGRDDDQGGRSAGARSDSLTAPVPLAADTAELFAQLPASQLGVVTIRGNPVSTAFSLYRGADHVMVVYLPAGIRGETKVDERGTHVRFVPTFGGWNAGDVEMDAFIPRDALSPETMRSFSRGLPPPRPAKRYPWTIEEFGSDSTRRTADQVLIGEHSGRRFGIGERYTPPAAAETVAPRFRAILDSWIWTDSMSPLLAGEHQ